jgi:hypothetical protein
VTLIRTSPWDTVFGQCVRDRRVTDGDCRTLLLLGEVLDYCEPRPLKVLFVARLLAISETAARERLRRLVDASYLVRRDPEGNGAAALYRLRYSHWDQRGRVPAAEIG